MAMFKLHDFMHSKLCLLSKRHVYDGGHCFHQVMDKAILHHCSHCLSN